MDHNLRDPIAYLYACRTTVPIEQEAASYDGCRYVRSRIAARTIQPHILEQLVKDREPAVVMNVIDNPACSAELVCRASRSLTVHSGEKWHVVWEAMIRNRHTPEDMRALFTLKERARQAKIRLDVKLPPIPELAPPQAAPLGKYTQRRIMLFMLRVEKNGRKNGVFTEDGLKYYAAHPSKLVQKALKKYKRHMARLKKKTRSPRK